MLLNKSISSVGRTDNNDYSSSFIESIQYPSFGINQNNISESERIYLVRRGIINPSLINSNRMQNYFQQLNKMYSKINADYIKQHHMGIDVDMTIRGSNQSLRPQENLTIDLNNTWGTQRNK